MKSGFEHLFADLCFATRQLVKNPAFACTAILVLALGMAASIAIFAFVDAALLQPLPYKQPSELVGVYGSSRSCHACDLSYQDFLDWKKDNTVFSFLEAWDFSVYLWRSSAGIQSVRAARVSGGFFRMLGVAPMLGRVFTEADDKPAAPRTMLLAYGAWRSRFGARPDIVGQSVILDDAAYTVVGVLPREFHFALRAAEFFTTIHDPGDCEKSRACRNVYAIARLSDGTSVQAAQSAMQSIAEQLERQYPDSNKGQGALVMPLREAITGDIRPTLLLLLGGACLLLLISCVNLASLLLVRTENRRREMALRSALGASLGRLVRLFLAEGIVLATLAVSLGLTAAYVAIPVLFQLIPERLLRGMPYFRFAGLHPRSLLFACIISFLALAVLALTPALRLATGSLRDDLAEGARSSAGMAWKHFSSNLVSAELALAMVLLAGAGLLGKSLYRLLHVDLNFDPEHIATLEIDTPDKNYASDERRIALSRRLMDGISTMPGVVSAAHTSDLPVTCNCSLNEFRVLGHPWNGEHQQALQREISVDYFKVLHTRLVEGRFYTPADDQSKPLVAIINQALAKQFFPNEDPIGQTIGDADLSPQSRARIAGVVEDIREGGLDDEILPAIYRPFAQDTGHNFFIAVRTVQDPELAMPALVAAIHRIDPDVGVRNEFTMTQHIGNLPAAFLRRSSAWLVGGFAASALLLGVLGLYAVIAYSVSRRTREIGVRMALGAQRTAVFRLILREAGLLTAVGVAAGMGCSIVTAGLMRHLLFGIDLLDLPVLLTVSVVLGLSALMASYLPARKAASVDPMDALRSE